MEVQQKARQLVDSFMPFVEAFSSFGQFDNAKHCALMCVEEIIQYVGEDYSWDKRYYWHDVKEAIKKL